MIRSVSICVLLAAMIQGIAAREEIELLRDHPAIETTGIKDLEFSNSHISLEAIQNCTAQLVLRCLSPTRIVAATGAEALLIPGWDGSLGYSLYSLRIQAPAPGPVQIKLEADPPPGNAAATSKDETIGYEKDLPARSSRFPDDPALFERWQEDYRTRLASTLMGGGKPKRIALAAQVLDTQEHPAFILRRVKYQSQEDRSVQLLISLPQGAKSAPLLVALHGHEGPWGQADEKAYLEPGHPDCFCGYFADRGWAVLQPATLDHHLQHPGWTLQGEWTWDAMAAIDYACTLPEINQGQIAVCGLSTGGHLAMNLLALDDRVQAGVVGCVLSTWNHYKRFRIPPHCDCGLNQQLPQLLAEQCDWAALAAPKPVQFHHGQQDASFCPGADPGLLNLEWNTCVLPAGEYNFMFNEVRRAWRIYSGEECVVTHIHGGKHEVDNKAAFEWLEKWRRDHSSPPKTSIR
jgi:dienelactone hydrolase